jgi:16S rRNA (adenine1518-N6/adenine1519-N6)-dimethyltransferase
LAACERIESFAVAKFKNKKPFAKRSFGQNFLVDDAVIGRICGSLALAADDTVFEIGAGRGALTGELVNSAARVIAIEIDRDLHPVLLDRFGGEDRFSLIADDILDIDLATIFDAQNVTPPAKLVGNLPYNISTAILERVIASRHLFSRVVFMFQREVVERITARPGDSERGFYTVLIEAAFESAHLFDVPPSAFIPRPKVWSSVMALTPKPASIADEPGFRKLLSAAFAQKRKTIFNNLKSYMPDALDALTAASIVPERRAETLSLDEWRTLYETIKSRNA